MAFDDHTSLIAGNGRVLVTGVEGQLVLVQADRNRFQPLSRVRLFEKAEVWSHPALVGNRLYVRNGSSVSCFLVE